MFLGILSGCSLTSKESTEATSGTEKMYKIGITQIADHPSLDNCREGFIEGLKAEGFEEGKNVTFDYKSAKGEIATANTIATSFVGNNYDLICAIATPSAQTAYTAAAEKKIPVIFSAVSDPVAAKLVNSLEKPGKGSTGTSDIIPVEKQLEMIRAFMPKAKKVGILYNTSEPNSATQIAMYEAAAAKFNFEIVKVGVAAQADIPMATDNILAKVDCITNLTDNLVVSNLQTVLGKANAKKIPVFGSEEEQVKNGCLASQGIDYIKLGMQTGKIAARVLKGEDINNIAVETIKESKLVVNENVLKNLSLTLPASLKDTAQMVK
ncbi:ABC transporter substrate-binding protein [Desulforamulus reducens]|uniref:ABC transporter substrate-binding protein n=1 Tax=Desulforamulus reducens TaxID=59610 RepID=UPI001EE4B520|nr:ABC transporter substrate-binding protein [Desulforamulus reducens]